MSSAAFWLVGATLQPGSDIVLQDVNVNETRFGIVKVLRRMGASITLLNERVQNGEPIADVRVVSVSQLIGTTVQGEEVTTMIDELPILTLALARSEGDSRVMDAGELRVKESNRINTVSETLVAYGADVKPTPDGFLITGVSRLQAPAESLSNHGDHRIAMLQSIAQLLTSNDAPIADQAAIAVSYPDFKRDMEVLMHA